MSVDVEVVSQVAAQVRYRDLLEAVKSAGLSRAVTQVRIGVEAGGTVEILAMPTGYAQSGGDEAGVSVRVWLETVAQPAVAGAWVVERGELERALIALAKGARKAEVDKMLVALAVTPDGVMAVRAGGYEVPLRGGDVASYPSDLQDQSLVMASVLVDRAQLVDRFMLVSAVAAVDKWVPLFTHVQVTLVEGELTMVATDRYRATRARLAGEIIVSSDEPVSVLLPAQLVRKALKLFRGDALRVQSQPGHVVLSDQTLEVVVPDGTKETNPYPSLDRLLSGAGRVATLTVSAPALLAEARRAVALHEAMAERLAALHMTITAEAIKLVPQTLSGATVTAPAIPADTNLLPTDTWTMGVNPKYLLDALTQFTCPEVIIDLIAPTKPIKFTDPITGFEHVLMPMRLH